MRILFALVMIVTALLLLGAACAFIAYLFATTDNNNQNSK